MFCSDFVLPNPQDIDSRTVEEHILFRKENNEISIKLMQKLNDDQDYIFINIIKL